MLGADVRVWGERQLPGLMATWLSTDAPLRATDICNLYIYKTYHIGCSGTMQTGFHYLNGMTKDFFTDLCPQLNFLVIFQVFQPTEVLKENFPLQ